MKNNTPSIHASHVNSGTGFATGRCEGKRKRGPVRRRLGSKNVAAPAADAAPEEEELLEAVQAFQGGGA